MMRSSFPASWNYNTKIMLAAAWLYPQLEVYQREIGLAAARRKVDADRYAVTIDKSLRTYVHSMLLPMLHVGGLSAAAAANISRSPVGANNISLSQQAPSPTPIAIVVDDSRAPASSAVDMSKPLPVHDSRYATWEKRLSREGACVFPTWPSPCRWAPPLTPS